MLTEAHDKQAIARAFGRAAGSYDRFAALQRASGERLLDMIAPHSGSQVLDAGCGTGHFSRRWQQLGKTVTALDLSAEMLARAAENQSAARYLLGDIENLPLAAGSVDISYSNLAVQWCDDLPAALAELYRVTRSGGAIAFSTLADGSLTELAQAWRRLDGSRRVNRFLPVEAIEAACRPYRCRLHQERVTCRFPDVLSVLKSLKGIGATWQHQDRAPGLLSRSRLKALSSAYPQQDGYPLSYQLVYGVIYRD
ncbi:MULTISPECIES: malonyl-ACP O-methyltransferase BioC [unclassified Brenneria]|uniref:malonyl-ACP O-methyltransferase BioC n=1 Tax=unclassified Brenneria TaxID=2634434 RepID=UPI0029C1B0D4|nr:MULTISPECIES: malonyl-ACP O-methyltransferase BioC [unclassified Brenneria]MDX5627238.1 malonyl-ACP O-methyltransferase BioC [Brenneria sp. L3-3Z]MDX5694606.1 malonyl-ACP O-methyltransferase BioC [Brenneria sp. L4-2C]